MVVPQRDAQKPCWMDLILEFAEQSVERSRQLEIPIRLDTSGIEDDADCVHGGRGDAGIDLDLRSSVSSVAARGTRPSIVSASSGRATSFACSRSWCGGGAEQPAPRSTMSMRHEPTQADRNVMRPGQSSRAPKSNASHLRQHYWQCLNRPVGQCNSSDRVVVCVGDVQFCRCRSYPAGS